VVGVISEKSSAPPFGHADLVQFALCAVVLRRVKKHVAMSAKAGAQANVLR